MKTKCYLFLCLLLLTIKCDSDDPDEELCEDAEVNSKEKCFDVFDKTIQAKGKYCCYIEYKLNEPSDDGESEGKGCQMFDEESYKNISGWIAEQQEGNDIEKVYVYCDAEHSESLSNSSSFLKLGLISLFAALLI